MIVLMCVCLLLSCWKAGILIGVQPPYLNRHLSSYMKGLTAKVFRTYNASTTFQDQLDQGTPRKGTVQEKLNAYNHANRMVAILCNHQRAVPKTHESSMQKMKEKVRVVCPCTCAPSRG